MYKYRFILPFLLLTANLPAIQLSDEQLQQMAEKIWYNECRCSSKGLTSWNDGEDFASMGIGHFIWYPEGRTPVFDETFPALLTFLEARGKTLPAWLQKQRKCPWHTKEDFDKEFDEFPLRQLRKFLYETRSDQAFFIAERLEQSLPKILANAPDRDKDHIESMFKKLSATPQGLFMLLDYVNFKGYGTSPTERYNGEGWGLLQVLQAMPATTEDPYLEFVQAAKKTLSRRVKNAIPERKEDRWIEGWYKRVQRYLE